jgi:phasin family protein
MSTNEQIQAAQKAELESMVSVAEKAMNGFEKLVQLNLETLRAATQDAAEAMRTAFSARDLQELMSNQATSPVQASSQKAMAYVQHVAEIAGSTQAELAEALNQSMARMQQALRDTMQSNTNKLPLGSEGVAALMQSAMNFTTQAFDAVQKSQTQATKMVSDNVQNLTQTAVKAVAVQTTPARKRTA